MRRTRKTRHPRLSTILCLRETQRGEGGSCSHWATTTPSKTSSERNASPALLKRPLASWCDGQVVFLHSRLISNDQSISFSPAFFTRSTRAISADGSLWMRARCMCTRKESTCRRAWRITCGRTRFTHVTCAKKRSTTSSTLRSITGSFTRGRRNQWRCWKILGRWIAQPSDR